MDWAPLEKRKQQHRQNSTDMGPRGQEEERRAQRDLEENNGERDMSLAWYHGNKPHVLHVLIRKGGDNI